MSEREKGWQAYFSQPRLMAILDDPLLLPRAKNGGIQLVVYIAVAFSLYYRSVYSTVYSTVWTVRNMVVHRYYHSTHSTLL